MGSRAQPASVPRRKRSRAPRDEQADADPATPAVFVDPSPTPAVPLLLAHRPVYPAAGLHSTSFDTADTPYRWVRVHARSSLAMMKMTVMAMVGDLQQTSASLHGGMALACSVLCLRIAEWMLRHPDHRVPSARNLNKIFRQVNEAAKANAFRRMLTIDEALRNIPGLDYEMEIQAVLQDSFRASMSPDPVTGKRTHIGPFDEMWDAYIAMRRDAVFVVNRQKHFFVLRIDKHGKFWVINTIGACLDEKLDRAFILAFGSGTIFSDDAEPNQLIFGLSSGEACRKYFRDYLGGDLQSIDIDEYAIQFVFFPIFLRHNHIVEEVNQVPAPH